MRIYVSFRQIPPSKSDLTDLSITDSLALLLLRILDLQGLLALHPAQSQRGGTFRKRTGRRSPAGQFSGDYTCSAANVAAIT